MKNIIDAGMVFYPSTDHPTKYEAGFSIDVLVDLNGKRKDFAIGWYDFDDEEWRFHSEDVSQLEIENMCWTFLPDQNKHEIIKP